MFDWLKKKPMKANEYTDLSFQGYQLKPKTQSRIFLDSNVDVSGEFLKHRYLQTKIYKSLAVN